MLEFDNQIEKLTGELEYNKSEDKLGIVFKFSSIKFFCDKFFFIEQLNRIEETYKKEAKELEKLKKDEQQQMKVILILAARFSIFQPKYFLIKVIDETMKKVEDMKMQRITKKSDVEDKENEAAEVKKQMAQVQKEMSAIQKQVTALETKMESKKSERHSLLQACKVREN